jgi:hypothetical protein
MRFEFNDLTLAEILYVILPDNIHLPHSQIFARTLYEKTVQKFLASSENERRLINRSDPEFMAIIRDIIIGECGFNNELEAFGKEVEIPEIPRIKRGNEIVWSHIADPQEPITEEVPDIVKKLHRLTKIVLQKIQEFYPDDYARSFSHPKLGAMVLNTSHEELIKQLEIADPKNFSRIGLPLVTRALLRHVAEKNYLNGTQVNEMYETILDASWGESEIGQRDTQEM